MEENKITLNEFVTALRFELFEHGNKNITSIGTSTGRGATCYTIDVDEGDNKTSSIRIPMYKDDYYKEYDLLK